MKRFYNYTFRTVCVFILVMIVYSIMNVEIVTEYNYADNMNSEKILSSSFIEKEITESESINVNEEIDNGNKKVVVGPVMNINIKDISGYKATSSEKVTISHFGHDCSGCGAGYVASGYYIGDGRLYYNDKTFGSLRIVAADYKYPLGTVIRLSYRNQSFGAIVLDRGGVGDGKKFQIDLLVESEAKASTSGVIYNASLEVLRLGY